jgi:hypothetical protein
MTSPATLFSGTSTYYPVRVDKGFPFVNIARRGLAAWQDAEGPRGAQRTGRAKRFCACAGLLGAEWGEILGDPDP